jgi:hypothetical protein
MLPLICSAQRVDKPGEPYYVYCEISSSVLSQVTIKVNKQKYWIAKEKWGDIEFEDEADVLSYMSKRGWEYIERNQAIGGLYIMRKKVINDDEALSYLDLVPTKKKKSKD